jgi:hypothetical protein
MRLIIDSAERELIPIKEFRQRYALPESFGVALFEPKDFAGLAAIDRAGQEMNELRQGLLNMLPERLTKMDLLNVSDEQREAFRAGLYSINTKINLKPEEVEFAVSGFGDVLHNWAYALIRGNAEFKQVYYHWLNDSVRVSQDEHEYLHEGLVWRVHILNHAYGRMGLRVEIGESVRYLADGIYSCPAEGYMLGLLGEICEAIKGRLKA